jgi:hypothetical protein
MTAIRLTARTVAAIWNSALTLAAATLALLGEGIYSIVTGNVATAIFCMSVLAFGYLGRQCGS